MMSECSVEFRNVSFKYTEEQPWVLKNCSFTVEQNESLAIIGHNGSGKSTIAKLMNGLLFPQEGEIFVQGIPVTPETVWDVRKEVGMVFQNPDNQFVGTTVQDDVAFGMENRGFPRDVMAKRIDEMLSVVGMQDYLLTEPHRLSGGQKQRVAIASVLAILPNILILDESTAMLDPQGRMEIMDTLSRVQQDRSISLITITHDLHEVIQAERVIVLNKGEIWDEGTPRHVFSKKEALREIGLDVPFITLLTEELNEQGLSIQEEPLNHEQLLEDLWTYYSKM